MSEGHTLMLSLTIYKVVTILAGVAFAYMGYKLFIHGIFVEAGEFRTNWENRNLVLRKAAPGTFFALFGTLIVCTSLWRGLTLEPTQTQGVGGTGLFVSEASRGADRPSPGHSADEAAVLADVATLNRFAAELLGQREQGETSGVTIVVEDSDAVLDLIDRTKVTLMLSVWSAGWGDREEFRRWALRSPGYHYSDPPSGIARAAAIFKGEGQ